MDLRPPYEMWGMILDRRADDRQPGRDRPVVAPVRRRKYTTRIGETDMRHMVLATATLLAMNSMGMSAQAPGRQTQADFVSFWTRFRAAVSASDKEAVASMTKLPFLFEGDELNKARFIEQFDRIFDRRVKARLLKTKPVKDGAYYEVFCGAESVFLFKRIDGKYKFVEIGVND